MPRGRWVFALLAAALAGVLAERRIAEIVPGAYIVEFEDNHVRGARSGEPTAIFLPCRRVPS